MHMPMPVGNEYIKQLRERGKESRVYRDFQLIGLEIAEILHDAKHKSLYIKMAKNGAHRDMLRIAKEIAHNTAVKNKGAYFMKVWNEQSSR